MPIVLGGDPKGKNFLYCNGNSVIIRNIIVSNMTTSACLNGYFGGQNGSNSGSISFLVLKKCNLLQLPLNKIKMKCRILSYWKLNPELYKGKLWHSGDRIFRLKSDFRLFSNSLSVVNILREYT